ncbi:unnamed protein product [Prorocentrum cordatum]|uniref:Uncharacterized protein n=1 Tax=Prorocentrum cordatum TaxID=2364126 RepID=A0ABN9W075_9DINO|nr:unnamed protein product [Polarella glacialis]
MLGTSYPLGLCCRHTWEFFWVSAAGHTGQSSAQRVPTAAAPFQARPRPPPGGKGCTKRASDARARDSKFLACWSPIVPLVLLVLLLLLLLLLCESAITRGPARWRRAESRHRQPGAWRAVQPSVGRSSHFFTQALSSPAVGFTLRTDSL